MGASFLNLLAWKKAGFGPGRIGLFPCFQLLFLFLVVLIPRVSGQNQPDKRFGEICLKLTGDPKCKVCEKNGAEKWICVSHEVWKEIPGSRVPPPSESPSGSPRKRSSGVREDFGDTSSDGCNRYWAPEFGQTSTPAVQATLQRHELIDQIFNQLGGPPQVITYVKTPGNLERDLGQLSAAQSQGVGFGSTSTSQDYVLIADGFVRIAKCRMGEQQNPGSSAAARFGDQVGQVAKLLSQLNPDGGEVNPNPVPPEVSPTMTRPELIDKDSFAKFGSNPIDNAVDDLMMDKPDCKALTAYRDNGLVKEFDTSMNKYNIFRDGKLNQEKIKSETQRLLDDGWWAGELGSRIAIEVKLYTDLFNDTAAWVAPEAYVAQLYGKGAATTVHLAQSSAITVGLVKTEVDEGAQKAATDAAVEVLKAVAGQAGAIPSMGYDIHQYNMKKEELTQYKSTVQERAKNIDRIISSYMDRMQQSQERMQAIRDVVATIDAACSAASIPINSPN